MDPKVATNALRRGTWGGREFVTSAPGAAGIPKGARARATIVQTEPFETPHAFALFRRVQEATSARNFLIDEDAWVASPSPAGALDLEIRRGQDLRDSATTDVHTWEALPAIVVGAQLSIDVFATSVSEGRSYWVELLAVPTDHIDPVIALGAPSGSLGGYSTATVTRIAANAAPVTLRAANPLRRQFLVQNNSAQDLAIGFGTIPSFAAGAESWSVLLPGGADAIYESPIGGFTGTVYGIWAAADAAGEALVTEGTP